MSDMKERLTRRSGVVKKTLDGRGDVFIRVMSTDEILAIGDLKDRKVTLRKMIADAVVEEDGTKIFTPEEAGALDWIVLKPLSDLVVEVNMLKLTAEQMEAAKKNSTATASLP